MMERLSKIQLWKKIGGSVLEKGAELANTYDMPAQRPVPQPPNTQQPRAVIRKTAGHAVQQKTPEDSDLVQFLGGQEREVTDGGTSGEQPELLPQMGRLQPHVDVTAAEPPKVLKEKTAQYYALPDAGMYPLDSYTQVKQAAQYFMENHKFMPPEDRHLYCGNLTKRASSLSVAVAPIIEKYGSDQYASSEEVEVGLFARRSALHNEDHLGILDKLAAVRNMVEPEVFAAALERFDIGTGLSQYYGADIPDAYFTTFGKTAAAIKSDADPLESVVIGNEYISRRRLAAFLANNVGSLQQRFGAELALEMAKNPSDIFDSLPRDQKLVIMRLANNDDSPVRQGVQTA